MNKPIHPLLQQLLEKCWNQHERVLRYDREGYPAPVRVCDKWKTRRWVDSEGINCEEWFGELDPNTPCSCGADKKNAEAEKLALELNQILTKNIC